MSPGALIARMLRGEPQTKSNPGKQTDPVVVMPQCTGGHVMSCDGIYVPMCVYHDTLVTYDPLQGICIYIVPSLSQS